MSYTCLVDGNAVAYTVDLKRCCNSKDFVVQYFQHLREYAKCVSSLPKFILFFDNKTDGTWRDEFYSDYQKDRKDNTYRSKEDIKDVELRRQYLIKLKETIDKSKYGYIDYPHTEADDLISLYCNNIQQDKEIVTIITTDKDLYQLIKNKRVQVFNIVKRNLIKDEKIGKDAKQNKIWLGDNSDSIPSVCKNVGIKMFPDFLEFLKKMRETETDPTDKEKAKKVCESYNIKYVPSFSNFSQKQLDINRKLIDLKYVVEQDRENNNILTTYIKENIEKVKFSPFALNSILPK